MPFFVLPEETGLCLEIEYFLHSVIKPLFWNCSIPACFQKCFINDEMLLFLVPPVRSEKKYIRTGVERFYGRIGNGPSLFQGPHTHGVRDDNA